jgi:hypothetical protein
MFKITGFVSILFIFLSTSLQAKHICEEQTHLEFACDRLPNLEELKADVLLGSALDMFVRSYVDLGGPAGSAIIRDVTKGITQEYKIYNNVSIGSTSDSWDESARYGQALKIFVKAGIISVGVFGDLMGYQVDIEKFARFANLPGDVVARALKNAKKEKKESHSKLEFTEYLTENAKTQWFEDAAYEIFPKFLFGNYMLEPFYEWTGLRSFVQTQTINLFSILTGNSLTLLKKETARQFISRLAGSQLASRTPAYRYGLPALAYYASTAVSGLITTIVLGTPSRIIIDSVEKYRKCAPIDNDDDDADNLEFPKEL